MRLDPLPYPPEPLRHLRHRAPHNSWHTRDPRMVRPAPAGPPASQTRTRTVGSILGLRAAAGE
jgi:hypothetical protein